MNIKNIITHHGLHGYGYIKHVGRPLAADGCGIARKRASYLASVLSVISVVKKYLSGMSKTRPSEQLLKNNASGFALVSVMIFAALGGVLATALLYGVGSQIKSAAREIRSEKAFFIAEAGVELAKAELRSDGASSFSATTNFGGGEARYRTTTNTPPNVIIWSTGTYENVSRVLKVAVLVEENDFPVDGAVGVYGTGAQINVTGNATIDGKDYNVPTNFDCQGGSCNGTLTTNPAGPGVFSATTDTVVTTSGSGDIAGNPPTTNGTSQFTNSAYWQDMADALIPQAAITLPAGTYNSITNLGTRNNPQITVVTGASTINGNVDGAGVLIVMNGVGLTLGGNFHYEGIIILLGNNTFRATGTVRIFGALAIAGGGGNITTTQGTPAILYSSQALANLKKLPLDPQPLSVVYWQEIK